MAGTSNQQWQLALTSFNIVAVQWDNQKTKHIDLHFMHTTTLCLNWSEATIQIYLNI